jgi:hypothetical protein
MLFLNTSVVNKKKHDIFCFITILKTRIFGLIDIKESVKLELLYLQKSINKLHFSIHR